MKKILLLKHALKTKMLQTISCKWLWKWFFPLFFSNRFNCFLFPPSCKIKVSPFLSTKKMCMNFLIAVCFAIACLALYPMNQVYMLTYDDINHLGSKFKLLSLISIGRYFIYLMVSINSFLLYITITWEGACAFSILILELFKKNILLISVAKHNYMEMFLVMLL